MAADKAELRQLAPQASCKPWTPSPMAKSLQGNPLVSDSNGVTR